MLAARAIRKWLPAILLMAALGVPVGPALAEEEPSPAASEPVDATPDEPTVAVVQGHGVNLRVGPRIDVRPVDRLDEGTILLIVERVPGWFGVRVPRGFPAAVAARFTTPVGHEGVRVQARQLNVRVHPPGAGGPMPGAFRDHPEMGAVLPLLERQGDWAVIWAPENIRAYVSADYVRELGPLSAHKAAVEAARRGRRERLEALAAAPREAAARRSGEALREVVGQAQQALYGLRMQAGIERAPVVEIINALEAALDRCRESPVGVRKLALAIRADLEAELEIRTARKDAEVARLRGLDPPAEKPPAPKIAEVQVRGEIRWEAAPRWRNGGEWVLWVATEPRYVLHLSTGLPHPLPDLKGNAGRGARTIRGRQSGERVFGLPVIEVRSIAE